jgi:hypothetical protein
VNCGIGAINGKTVCNDGWLSSVPYGDMIECVGYNSSCVSYLEEPQFSTDKRALKNELSILEAEVDRLEFELNSLDYEEFQAVADYEESKRGSGATRGGIKPQIDAIRKEYALKKAIASQAVNVAIYQYNALVRKYNGICRKYTTAEKDGVCIYNFGSGYECRGGFCVERTSSLRIPTTLSKPKVVNKTTQYCQDTYGNYTYGSGDTCKCAKGYDWNSAHTACVAKVCPVYATWSNGTCTCNDGYVLSGKQCITYTADCAKTYGDNVIGSKGPSNNSSCNCSNGYIWNNSKTACIKEVIIPAVEASKTFVPEPILIKQPVVEKIVNEPITEDVIEKSNVKNEVNESASVIETISNADEISEEEKPAVMEPEENKKGFWNKLFDWFRNLF